MKENALYIQSGGPTAVINASAYGVIREWRSSGHPGKLYGARHGMIGLLQGKLIDVNELDTKEIELLPSTPSMIFGSCRYRVQKETDYEQIRNVLEQYHIRYLLFNGGNGTVRACLALEQYLERSGYDCRVAVIPKTVDNDIFGIDHSPGFPSAARHVALSLSEISRDLGTYDTGLIATVEVMGRNTGFLAAASILAGQEGNGPDLIYVPEVTFQPEKFLQDVNRVYREKGKCLAVLAEGIKTSDGHYLFEHAYRKRNGDPQLNMGGISPYIYEILQEKFSCKIRCIDLGLSQRCAVHDASEIDIKEAEAAGRQAVRYILDGENGFMVSMRRTPGDCYQIEFFPMPLAQAAGRDAVLPIRYLNKGHNYICQEFTRYIEPLVGPLPIYAKLPEAGK